MLDVDALERLRDELFFDECRQWRLQYLYRDHEEVFQNGWWWVWENRQRVHNLKNSINLHILQHLKHQIWWLENMQNNRASHLKSQIWQQITMRQVWLCVDCSLANVLPNVDARHMICNYVLSTDTKHAFVRRITAHIPVYSIRPPCSFVARPRWKVRQKWVRLIARMPLIDHEQWMTFWGTSSYFCWATTYTPFRLKT